MSQKGSRCLFPMFQSFVNIEMADSFNVLNVLLSFSEPYGDSSATL
jgi:hypothetical protein